ncbi:sulfatase-like hydrolase/transferase [Candidatus Pacearchaeota archaeon]|nr:sulfatase-like hydrolase/transferase [Candidatus Pacearchaeota archaeon]
MSKNKKRVKKKKSGKEKKISENKFVSFFRKHYVLIFLIFIFVNSLKIILFSDKIFNSSAFMKLFIYKMILCVILVGLIYVMLLNLRRGFFILFYFIQIVYFVLNYMYYKYFLGFFNVVDIFYVLNSPQGIFLSLGDLFSISMLFLIIDIPLFILIFYDYKNFQNKFTWKKKIIVIVILIIFLLLFELINFSLNQSILQKDFLDINSISKRSKDDERVAIQYGLFINNLYKLFNDNEIKAINGLKYGPEIKINEKDKQYNILVIQVESLDSYVINQTLDGKEISPYLNYLMNNSIYYPYVVSYHGKGSTTDSEFSVLNSLDPPENFASFRLKTYNYENSISRKFKSNGYNTYAFHGNDGKFFNRKFTFGKLGFNYFYDLFDMNLNHVSWGAPDSKVFSYVLNKITEEKENFYYHVITMSLHKPFNLHKRYHKLNEYDINNSNLKKYYNSVTYSDNSFKDFIEAVRRNKPNTYIFIYGDHSSGIKYLDDKYSRIDFKGNRFEIVPLFIITPDSDKYFERKRVISFKDIGISVLEGSGIKSRFKSDGANLLDYPILDNDINYKGEDYDRKEVYLEVSNYFNEN